MDGEQSGNRSQALQRLAGQRRIASILENRARGPGGKYCPDASESGLISLGPFFAARSPMRSGFFVFALFRVIRPISLPSIHHLTRIASPGESGKAVVMLKAATAPGGPQRLAY